MRILSRQTKKKFDRLSLTWFSRVILFLSKLLPYGLGIRLGGLLGFLAYYVLPRDRKRALAHLTSVFSEKGRVWIQRTARRGFMHLGKALLEVILLDNVRLSRIVDFKGYENLRRAAERGRGVVVVTGHLGNWEILAAAVAAHYPVSVVAAPIKPEPVNNMLVQLRASKGVKTILRDRPGASRDLIRVFRQNRVLEIGRAHV
jgi:KDO2-lipid IV(A) lauroyltransferase